MSNLQVQVKVLDSKCVPPKSATEFSAGYDLRTKTTVSMYLDILEELVGLRYTGLVHLNDSKNNLGANIDRHESLGKGYIGNTGLKIFAKFEYILWLFDMKRKCISIGSVGLGAVLAEKA